MTRPKPAKSRDRLMDSLKRAALSVLVERNQLLAVNLELLAALDKYAYHLTGCGYGEPDGRCDCGYNQARAALNVDGPLGQICAIAFTKEKLGVSQANARLIAAAPETVAERDKGAG